MISRCWEGETMGLSINSGETKIVFSVDEIGNNNTDNYSDLDYWMIITVSVKNRVINYFHHNETLEYGDLVWIRDSFNKLLTGQITENTKLSFIEPDFEFELFPKIDLRTIPGYWCAEGHEIQDISTDFIINLTNSKGSYSGERYILPMNRKKIIAWRDYLNEAILEFDARNITPE